LVADVGDLDQVLVQAGFAQGVLKQRLAGPGGAAADDDAVQPLLPDGFLDARHGGAGAAVPGHFGHGDPAQLRGMGGHGGDIDAAADVEPAVADEDTTIRSPRA
jgi:hypothetical protein